MTDARSLISDELVRQVEESARVQNKEPATVLQEAVTQYLAKRGLRDFVDRMEQRNRKNGRAERDVPRAIAEVRRENLQRGR
jgi:predicted transcriptional regulator